MKAKVNFCDVVNGYIYVLFGFFAHLYVIFANTIFFEFQHHLGVSKETLINYFAILTIICLLFSLYQRWTWHIKIEEALIVICIWILLRNILPKECTCCNPPPPTVSMSSQQRQILALAETASPTASSTNVVLETVASKEEDGGGGECSQQGAWQSSNLLYSVMCLIVMLSSFLMNARDDMVSLGFTVITIVLVILTTIIPVSCNRFDQADITTNLLKFTLYSVVWFLNRRMRLSERVVSMRYLESMEILYSYDDIEQNHLLCGVKHDRMLFNKQKRNINTITRRNGRLHEADECDAVAHYVGKAGYTQVDSLIPKPLFKNLDSLCHNVINTNNPGCTSRIYKGKTNDVMGRNFACQLRNLKKIHSIHSRFNSFFSWKHRLYDSEIQNIFDLSKTLWILNICPVFLLFVFLEYLLLNYHTHTNIKELKCLIQHVKVMRYVQCASLNLK